MTIIKELAVVTRKYTDKNGQEKAIWQNIGAIHEHNGKQYMTLESWISLAALTHKEGDTRVFVSMFDPKPREGRQQDTKPGKSNAPGGSGDFEDDIPF